MEFHQHRPASSSRCCLLPLQLHSSGATHPCDVTPASGSVRLPGKLLHVGGSARLDAIGGRPGIQRVWEYSSRFAGCTSGTQGKPPRTHRLYRHFLGCSQTPDHPLVFLRKSGGVARGPRPLTTPDEMAPRLLQDKNIVIVLPVCVLRDFAEQLECTLILRCLRENEPPGSAMVLGVWRQRL